MVCAEGRPGAGAGCGGRRSPLESNPGGTQPWLGRSAAPEELLGSGSFGTSRSLTPEQAGAASLQRWAQSGQDCTGDVLGPGRGL